MDKNFKIAVILTAVDKMSNAVSTAVAKTQKRLKAVSTGLDSFANKAMIAGGVGTLFFAKSIQAAEESEIAHNRLSQVFKSMGQDYVKATEASEKYASQLQSVIGVEDETIMAVQAKLATFEKAANAAARSNGIFNRATNAAFDMAAAGFGEAEQNIVQLGKALQDPIKGINALSRSGITFTAAEKNKIKALVAANKTFEAQQIVMKAIEKQVGGVAAKTVSRTQRMKVAWGEIMEQIGSRLLPAFAKFTDWLMNRVIPAVSAFIDKHPGLVKWLAIAAVSLLVVGAVSKVAAFGISALSGVLGFLAKTLRIVGVVFVWLGRIMLANPIIAIATAIALIVVLIIRNWSKIKAFFTNILNAVVNAFKRAWKWITGIVSDAWNWVVEKWSALVGFFEDIGNKIGNALNGAWNWIVEQAQKAVAWLKNIWSSFKEWLSDTFGSINKFVDKQIRKAQDAMINANIEKQTSLSGIWKVVAPDIVNRGNRAGHAVLGPNKSPTPSPVPIVNGGNTNVTFNPTYHVNGGDPNAVMEMMKKQNANMLKVMQEAQRKKDRTKF